MLRQDSRKQSQGIVSMQLSMHALRIHQQSVVLIRGSL